VDWRAVREGVEDVFEEIVKRVGGDAKQ
jgi:hypothetical protein